MPYLPRYFRICTDKLSTFGLATPDIQKIALSAIYAKNIPAILGPNKPVSNLKEYQMGNKFPS